MESPSVLARARNYVAKMPAAVSGSGGHNATFHVACVLLQGFNLSVDEARSILAEYNARCEPPWSERELEHKLRQADNMPGLQTCEEGLKPRGCLAEGSERDDRPKSATVPAQAPSAPDPIEEAPKADFSPGKLRAFAARWREFIDTAWLADRSPVPPFTFSSGPLCAEDYLKAVFREGERVIVFTNQRSQGQAVWPLQGLPAGARENQLQPPELRNGDAGVWFLVQPVDGRSHPNPRSSPKPDGSPAMSRRSEESVTEWRHLLLESDKADPRDWLGAIVQLPLRIVSISTSGGRSIHAIVRVDARTVHDWNNKVKELKGFFATMGADTKALRGVQLSRLPGAWRHGKEEKDGTYVQFDQPKLQKLLYLNPQPEPVALCTLPRRGDLLAGILQLAQNAMSLTPADLHESGEWETLERCELALRWFESSPKARAALKQLEQWKGE